MSAARDAAERRVAALTQELSSLSARLSATEDQAAELAIQVGGPHFHKSIMIVACLHEDDHCAMLCFGPCMSWRLVCASPGAQLPAKT